MKRLILFTNLVLLVYTGFAQSITNPASDGDIRYTNTSFTVSWGYQAGTPATSCLDCNCNGVCDKAENFSAADCASYDVVPSNCTINTGGTTDNNWTVSTTNTSNSTYTSHGTVNCSSGTCSKTITITSEGAYEINVTGNNNNYKRNVTVYTRPSNPAAPTEASSSTCYDRILQRSGTPPSNVTYYWQNTLNGTATNLGSGATKSVNSGTWYLRARRTVSSGVYVWSSGTTSGISVTEYASPASYTISAGDNTICSEVYTSIRLSDSQSNYTYRLLKNGSVHGSTIGGTGSQISWSGQDIGTYQIEAKRTGSCPYVTVSGTTSVTRQNPGTLSIGTTGDLRGCPGQSITLTGSGGSNLEWAHGDATDVPNPLSVGIYEGGDITYTLSGNENQCNTLVDKSVVVGGYLPVKGVTIDSGITSRCQGAGTSVFTHSNAQNATSYTWSITPNSAGSIDQNGQVTWLSGFSGEATIKVTAFGECSTSREDTHVVNVIAPANSYSHSIIEAKSNLCLEEKTTISLSGSQSGYKYRLMKNTSSDLGVKTSNYTWSNLDVGSYKIQGRPTGEECSWVDVTSSITINRKDPGTLSIGTTGDLRGCPGQSITLTGSGGSNLEWAHGDATDVPNPLSVGIYEGGDITYTLSGNENQCNTLVDKSVVVGGYLPVKGVTIDSGITSRCQGAGTSVFTHSDAQNETGGYQWSITPTSAGTIDDDGQVEWLSGFSGEATIKITVYGDCSSFRDDTRVIDVIPPANSFSNTINEGTNQLCADDRTTISLGNAQEGYKYRLMKNTSSNQGTKFSSYTWTNLDVGDYKIQGRPTGNECSWVDVTEEIEIQRLDPGEIRMAQSGPLTGCNGDWVTITPTGGSGYSLREVGDDNDIPAEQNGTFRVQVRSGLSVSYDLTGTESVCSTTDSQRIVVVSNEPFGDVVFDLGDPEVCQGDQDVVYSIETVPRANISWSLEPSESGTIANGVVDWDADWHGEASVRATATGPCGFNTSGTFQVIVTPNATVPTFENAIAERNMGSGTTDYEVNVTGADAFSWSLTPGTAGTVDTTSGLVTWSPAYYGPTTIEVTATGACGASQSASTETLVKNPGNFSLIAPQTNDIFLTGESMSIEWPQPTDGWLYNIYYQTDMGMVPVELGVSGELSGGNLVYTWNDVPAAGSVDIIVTETRDLVTFQALDVELIDHLDVTAPLAQSYGKESETNITWTGGSAQSGFVIELYENGVFHADLGVGTNGSMPWLIPANLSNTYTYRIRVAQDEQEAFSEEFMVQGCVELVTLSEDKNYVRTMVPRVPVSECLDGRSKEEVVQSVAYVDGLGRPIQSIQINGSPEDVTGNAFDIIQHVDYDEYGRQTKSYLPFPGSSNTGTYLIDPILTQQAYYNQRFTGTNDGDYAYSEQIPENSPLNRPLSMAAPGEVWSTTDGTHLVENTYLINDGTENIPNVYVDDLGQVVFVSGTFYGAGELSGTKVTDENNGDQEGETITWINKAGQTVLKAVKIIENSTVKYMKTLYGYDEFGNLRFVIQPQGVRLIEDGIYSWSDLRDTGFRDKWMFTYAYDHRHRMVEKSVPGAQPVKLIYDYRDRLVMTRDGNQNLEEFTTSDVLLDGSTDPVAPVYEVYGASIKLQTGFHVSAATGDTFLAKANPGIENGGWVFTKYDHLNRPIMTGQAERTLNYDDLVDEMDTYHHNGGAYGESFTGEGPLFGYTNDAYPFQSETDDLQEDDLFTVTYYDNYDFTNESLPPDAEPEVFGQVTGVKTRVLGTDNWLTTISFYDERYRVVQTISENLLEGRDVVTLEYLNAISGLVTKTTTVHTGGEPVTIVEEHTYDHMDRLLTTTHKINDADPVVIASNTYNKMGELIEKNVGGSPDAGVPVQSIDYDYNIRGWLTHINGGESLDAGENDQFGMRLSYQDATGFEQYNGNIGQVYWKTLGSNGEQTTATQQFNYTYDAASRIQSADYVGGNNDLSSIGYDFNGNIEDLSRNTKDILTYDYGTGQAKSNQLLSVTDAEVDNTTLFIDGNTTGNDYAYDDNGNLTKDLNKEISSITYNHLNLPKRVLFADGKEVLYTYDATGIKLLKEVVNGALIDSTAYIGGIHYTMQDDGSGSQELALSFVQHGAGRTLKNDGVFQYQFNLTDHLGNVRVTINESGSVVQRDDYYPFGLTFNSWTSGTENLYKLTGNEEQKEWSVFDFNARMYDPMLGRFNSVDPLADTQDSWNPYHYNYNNPLAFVDPTGLAPEATEEEMEKFEKAKSLATNIYTASDSDDGNGGGNGAAALNKKTYGQNAGLFSRSYTDPLTWGSVGTGVGNFFQSMWESVTTKEGWWDILNTFDTSPVGMLDKHRKNFAAFEEVSNIPNLKGDDLGVAIGALTAGAIFSMVTKKFSLKSRPLYHYTSEAGYNAIMESQLLNPSIGVKNARYGPGQYFTDLAPENFTIGQASHRLYGVPWNKTYLTHHIKVETSGLNIIKNKAYNFLHPSKAPLPLNGLIIGGGKSNFKVK